MSEPAPPDVRLRAAIDELADQLCFTVDGNFDFAVRASHSDEALEKLAMLTNFVLDTARRGMTALRAHNAALSELDRAKTAFFSNVSHEFRTPLTLIVGPLEDALARDAPLSGDGLRTVYRNALRLLKMVNALLDFARIEAGRARAWFQPTDVAAATAELASMFRSAVERAGLRLTVDCEASGDPPVFVDRAMWETIVLNLLSNALKFTFEGEIAVTLRRAGETVVLEVRDTGVGIPEAELPRLFDRFRRVEGTRSRTHEGTGIGLALVQELVRMHGGSVSVSSELDRGTSFRVTLPTGSAHLGAEQLVPESAQPTQSAAPAFLEEAMSWIAGDTAPKARPVVAASPGPSASHRILVADDNADMRTYISRLLGEHWRVDAVADGAQALASALADPPSLVLSDVMMPGLDGYGLLRELRADPRTSMIPVVLLSARAGEEARLEGIEAGADDYLVKPFSGRELVARVRTHLELWQLRMDAVAIQRIGALLNAHLDLQSVVQILTDEATKVTGAEFGAFFYNVVDAAGGSYMLYTLAGASRERFAGFPMPRNTAVFQPTFDGEGVVRSDDITIDSRYGKSAPFHGMPPGHLPVRSYLAAPVTGRGGDVLGGLFFGHSTPGMFTARSERVLVAIAAQAAVAIENARLYERAEAARKEAESATRAKDEFLAMLGHELRNPLAPIVTALHLMKLRGDASTAREREIVGRQVDHLVRLVDDLLDVSRITQGKVELARRAVDIAEVVAKAIEMSSPILEQRRHRLAVSLPRDLVVDADPVRLAQVVANLLTNAAKYTEPNGDLVVTAAREDDTIALAVRDDGIGIAPEMLPHVFDMFVQGRQSLARSQGGLGLGLAIVKSLVTLHGGTVEARSPGPGKGTEMIVRLPAFAPPRVDRVGSDPRDTSPEIARTRGARILVVDDNEDAAELLADTLTYLGHDTRVAHDGPSALDAAIAYRPTLALVDIGLPVMDGYEVAERLRALPELGKVRLVAVTGYGQSADRERGAEAGFEEHLVKPIDVDQLAPLIERLTKPTD